MGREQVVSGRILTVPNVISLLRLALVPVFAVLIVRGEDVGRPRVLAVSGASDWLDGVIARRLTRCPASARCSTRPRTASSSS